MRGQRWIVVLWILLLIALSTAAPGCLLERFKDSIEPRPGAPSVTISSITYNWTRRTAYLVGEFTGSGRVNGVRVVVGEIMGETVIPWFDHVFYIRQDVSAGDPFQGTAYGVDPPKQQAFRWKAVVTDVF